MTVNELVTVLRILSRIARIDVLFLSSLFFVTWPAARHPFAYGLPYNFHTYF
ncbi:hypothetical protein RhiirA4_391355 [Rhizophagus irregularis]|uniref:Uncharacterized protein n=1 Tax=Rhizophagus irregularis TaxID=588596 RepID=A0A2I1FUK7_9GLOM|nr:hypothetical protein RhiirA4_391355 [Rhizophagus irregularis]